MNKALVRTSLLVSGLALVFALAPMSSAEAASSVYTFIARGVITDFDDAGGTAKIDITKVDGKGKSDLEGNNTEFIVNKAGTVYKNTGGKDKKVTYHNLVIGQEVGIKGVKKDDDTYVVSFIRIHDRSFTMVGNLESYDKDAHTLTLLVTSSTYKPGSYNKKNVKVNMVFGDDYSTFYANNGKTAVSFGDVNADAQKVKVMGVIENNNTWKVQKLWNEYKGKEV